MVDIFSKEKRSSIMASIRSTDTKPEKKIRSLLHRSGYRFSLHRRDLPGTPDIVLPRWKTAIQVRGCFWHQHPNCRLASLPKTRKKFWKEKLAGNVLRDKKNDRLLKRKGWNLIVVRECGTDNKGRLDLTLRNIVNRISRAYQ